jgi:hypothetical protein
LSWSALIASTDIYRNPFKYGSIFDRDSLVLLELQDQIAGSPSFQEMCAIIEKSKPLCGCLEGQAVKNQILSDLSLDALKESYDFVGLAVRVKHDANPLLKSGIEEFINVFLGKFRCLVFHIVKETRSFKDAKGSALEVCQTTLISICVVDRMVIGPRKGEETLIWSVLVLKDGTVVTGDSLGSVTFWKQVFLNLNLTA